MAQGECQGPTGPHGSSGAKIAVGNSEIGFLLMIFPDSYRLSRNFTGVKTLVTEKSPLILKTRTDLFIYLFTEF